MKLTKQCNTNSKKLRRLVIDDMMYLQKRISGKSVYKSMSAIYLRKPKHRKFGFEY